MPSFVPSMSSAGLAAGTLMSRECLLVALIRHINDEEGERLINLLSSQQAGSARQAQSRDITPAWVLFQIWQIQGAWT